MATIKIELLTSKTLKKENDRHPIYITVFKDGIPRRKMVGAAFEEEWDDDKKMIKPKGRKDHVEDNIKIEDDFDKYNAVFKVLDRSGNNWHADDVFKEIPTEIPNTFYTQTEDYIKTLEEGSYAYDSANSRLEKIKRYTKVDFSFDSIDKKWIAGFIKHCKTNEKSKTGEKGNSDNTISYAIKFIKKIAKHADAITKDLKDHTVSFDKNIKNKLTSAEMLLISNLAIRPDILKNHARNIFMVQFYFRGMRIGDALRLEWSDIKHGRLVYDSSKTDHPYDMKIVKECTDILNFYKGAGTPYVFPFLRFKESESTVNDFKNEMKNRTMVINRMLKDIAAECGITKTITTHIARHSFASIADQQLGGDMKTLQGLLGHSSREMTEIYIRDVRRIDDLDDAADKVILG